MKKSSLFLRGILLLALLTGLAVAAQPAGASTLLVCAGACTYHSIASALTVAVNGDTVYVEAGTYHEHDLNIGQSITVAGAGTGLVIVDAGHAGRIFFTSPGISITISGMTLTNGQVTNNYGAAIENHASLTLNNVVISNNQILFDPGVHNPGQDPVKGHGGGIYSRGDLTINHSSLINNTSIFNGGAIELDFGHNLALEDVVIQGNQATDVNASGGGITVLSDNLPNTSYESSLSMNNVTMDHNSAGKSGGGIYVQHYASISITNSTFSNNEAGNNSVEAMDAGGGGMDISDNSSVTLTNDTIYNNSVHHKTDVYNLLLGGGGGIRFNGLSITANLTNLTIVGNSATLGGGIYAGSNASIQINLKNSILYGNTATGNNGWQCYQTIHSLGFNLIQTDPDCTITGDTSDDLSSDPNLGSFGWYSGSTYTLPLPADSPAVDHGTNSGCPTTDQRGIGRPYHVTCDIGAFEYRPLNFIYLTLAGR